jgi:hypothetical protein
MKKFSQHLAFLMLCTLFAGLTGFAQSSGTSNDSKTINSSNMKTYVIERNIPGAGQFTAQKLKDISRTSCSVLKDMGPGIQWVQSYVTGDKIFCIYKAENMELLREHAKKGGFPIDNIFEVSNVISPATAN